MPIPWEAIAPRTRAPTAVRILDDHVGAGPRPLLLREGTHGPPIAYFHSTVIVAVVFVPPVTNIQAARALVERFATRVDSLPASLLRPPGGGGTPHRIRGKSTIVATAPSWARPSLNFEAATIADLPI